MLKTTRDLIMPTAITGSYPRPLWYDASLGGRSFKAALGDLVSKSLDLRRVGHIGEMRRDAQALRQPRGLAKLPGFRHSLFGDVAHRDIAGLRGQLADELAPHSRAAAGDDRDLPREFLHVSPPSD